MRSIEDLVPKGLLQRMQRQGSSCLIRMGEREDSVKFSWGCSLITFSGQVFLHRPHWTQASSVKLSIGRSGLSDRAPVGQADTQARQRVQPSVSIARVPKGAPAARNNTGTGSGATLW